MFDTLVSMPVSFWVALAVLIGGIVFSIERIRTGIGFPMIAVLGTVAVWYMIDLFYNGYAYYEQTFTPPVLSKAWWQVTLFLGVFIFLAVELHSIVNAKYREVESPALRMAHHGVDDPYLQHRLTQLLRICVAVWWTLLVIAAFRLGGDVIYYVFPFLDQKLDPWGRDRIGSGIDALLSFANYAQLFTAACFGIAAALLTDKRMRGVAIATCFLAWPYFIFDRTRNVMLSSMLPGILSWVILRMRGLWVKKLAVLLAFLFLVNVWFGFVIANRSNMKITEALQEKGLNFAENSNVHHEGLNMFEELCWINTLTDSGVFQPPWGSFYFAELVLPVPRALWPGKPISTLEYAVARGQAGADVGEGATISTGMIGQGVVNFGPYIGPPFAALLMSLWVVILARIDLRGQDLVLYGFGLILTFNLGRDITMLTLFTFILGSLTVWIMNRLERKSRIGAQNRMPMLANRFNSRV